ncbi:hypothetical protein BJ138DRAFT_991408, partial [Hygrophoropsis aurantiaca]
NSSIRVALELVGTEEGDSSERVGYVLAGGLRRRHGVETFCNVKCHVSGLKPVLPSCSHHRALKMHSGG